MNRRLRTAICGAAVGALLLAACGDGGDSSDGSSLTIWNYYTAGGQNDALEQQNERWIEDNPDVDIEVVQIPLEQLPSKLLATATTQDGPDIVLDNVVVDFPSLASAGVLADMTEYWDEYEDSDQFADSAVWRQDDKVYNVMSYTNLLGLYYNADALDELGIEPPTTIDDFQDALEAVANDGRYTPLSMAGAPTVEGAWMFMPLLLGDGQDYCNLEQSSLQSALERLQSWTDEDIVPREAANWDQTDAWQSFATGRYVFGINGNWNLGDAPDASFDVGTVRFPAGSEGSRVFPGGEGLGIGAFADDPDLAWRYIEEAWLSADASLINFEASGQIPTRAELADDPKVVDDELVQPFVEAASETAAWPLNEKTADMQTAIGKATSAVISGQEEAAGAAQTAYDDVTGAREDGGGGCS
ncbi:ABC transporter substrate-binding protein [Aeromicrobium sp. CTD01-1L150]|uniref:ABC transporter substrate-binding protein n=1 Tax=Aeromicrobium sp. CTD01-1L150 TaxID=3341830 RepID=UPI0035C18296